MTTSVTDDAFGSLIRETFRSMVRRVDHCFDETEITLSQWLTLKLAANGQVSCIGDINRELGLESGVSTRLVDQMEASGLLQRQRSTTDRRVVGLYLTVTGRDAILAMQPKIARFWKDQLAIFSVDERDDLFRLLTRLRDRLNEASNPAID